MLLFFVASLRTKRLMENLFLSFVWDELKSLVVPANEPV